MSDILKIIGFVFYFIGNKYALKVIAAIRLYAEENLDKEMREQAEAEYQRLRSSWKSYRDDLDNG